MGKRQRSGKLNNAGMSLVEVVVAIAILSIAIIPILFTFVQSARYNAKARVRQQTTAAAQTVMENFKAYSVEEIAAQFDADIAGSGNGFNVSRSSGFNVSYTGAPGGDMEFDIYGMQYQNANYDVKVELTSHNSNAADVENSLIYDTRTREHDAVYTGYASMDADALTGIMGQVAEEWAAQENAAMPDLETAVTHSASEVDTSLIDITERRLTVDIRNNASGNYVATVTCEYEYEVIDYPYETDESGTVDYFSLSGTYVPDLSGSTDPTNTDYSSEIFNQSTELTGLTLYYYPAYGYGAGSPVQIDKDSIIIQNSCGNEVKCYIYKQKNLAVSDTKISTSELVYDVYLQLSGANIYDDNLNTVLGNDTTVLGNDTVRIADSKIHVSGGSRYLGVGFATVKTDSEALDSETTESLRLMYDVLISVYNSGELAEGGTPLNTLEGTIIE